MRTSANRLRHMTISEVKRAAIYARISKSDSNVDKIENQVTELTALAASNEYRVAAIFEDDDISAYKGEKRRPGFEEMIVQIKEKKFDVVMATEPQRLTRGSAEDLEALAVLCVRANAIIHTRSAGVQDPATPTTLALMKIMDVIGGLEVASKIERQKARNRADLAKGLPTKGLRPFGWEKDRVTLREGEAQVVREAYEAILDRGESVWKISQTWNRLGVTTDSMQRPRLSRVHGDVRMPSGVWTTSNVRQILLRPRNAGLLFSDGAEMPISQIEPIVSREDWEAVCAAISSPSTLKGPKPQYLLGGILECTCGERMHASKSVSQRKGGPKHSYQIYRCRLYGFDRTQPHVTCQLEVADKVVRDWIVENIGLGLDTTPAHDRDELSRIDDRLRSLAEEDARAAELIIKGLGDKAKNEGFLRANKSERENLEDKKAQILSASAHSHALAKFKERLASLPEDAFDSEIDAAMDAGYAAWDEMSMENKRAILRGGYRVQLLAGGRGPERIQVSSKFPGKPY